MSKAVTQRYRRTYFNNPLIEESLAFLPAAVQHPTTVDFRAYLAERLPQSSAATRRRCGEYIAHRFSQDGRMNLELARALGRFGDSRVGRDILFFELILAAPLLLEVASRWLAELGPEGGTRAGLLEFLVPRVGGRNTDQIATAAVVAFRRCRKLVSPRPAQYIPVRASPPLEVFLYVLARLFPERTMARVDVFAGMPEVRAMLWRRDALRGLLDQAWRAGHVSATSELDQYHQFTLAAAGPERMERLLEGPVVDATEARDGEPAGYRRSVPARPAGGIDDRPAGRAGLKRRETATPRPRSKAKRRGRGAAGQLLLRAKGE
ncbi:MAG: hypothetical protein HY905_16960 [Deltaproteobacteria bacterium]|nr:hypothetical protein [Deltaproteobacteria bacterium]